MLHFVWGNKPALTEDALASEPAKFLDEARVALSHVPDVAGSAY
jgi:hypothetical protein